MLFAFTSRFGGAVVFAVEATDGTGDRIRLIIIGLLLVAALLAGLTVWYWRRTDPRKRVGDQLVDPPVVVAPAPLPVEERSDAALLADDAADEWLRLTGPDALRDR